MTTDIDHRCPGTIGWVELTSHDPIGAATFYGAVLGWHVERTDTPYGPYDIAWAGGAETAGLRAAPPEMRAAGIPPAWTVYVRAAALDDMVSLVEDAGGKATTTPTTVTPDTRVAMITDATGASLGLIEGPPEGGLQIRTAPGALCWAEVLSRDVAVSEEFYRSVFGWEASTDLMGGRPYTTFKLGKLHVGGMLEMPEMVPAEAPSHWLAYFDVTSCQAAVNEAEWHGGRTLVPPMTVGPGTFAILQDPEGAGFAVFEALGMHG